MKTALSTLELEAETVSSNSALVDVIDFVPPASSLSPVPKTAEELMTTTFPPIKWIINGVLPEGLTLIAGPPKLGKSWLCFDIALSVSFGSTVLGEKHVVEGDVLLLALEDNPRRIQSRFKMLAPNADWSQSRLTFESTASVPHFPALDQGGLDRLEEWADSVPYPTLIVMDVLQKVRPEAKSGENEYKAIYRGLKDLHRFASQRGISVLAVHHTRKSTGYNGDPFEKISGSMGLTALADTSLVLDHSGSGNCDAILYGRGRDLEEFELALDFDDGHWRVIGDAQGVERSRERGEIIKALEGHPPEGMTSQELAGLLKKPDGSIRRLLAKMAKANEVDRISRGSYGLPKKQG